MAASHAYQLGVPCPIRKLSHRAPKASAEGALGLLVLKLPFATAFENWGLTWIEEGAIVCGSAIRTIADCLLEHEWAEMGESPSCDPALGLLMTAMARAACLHRSTSTACTLNQTSFPPRAMFRSP